MLDPSSYPIVGPGAPYVSPQMLVSASTGISWATIPDRNSTPDQQLSEQFNICVRATAMVDQYCNQPLRATIDTEQFTGPGEFRVQNQPTGVTRLLTSRSPITAVLGGRVSAAASFPRSWNSIPANQFEPEIALIGVYGTTAPGNSGGGGQAILMAPGNCTWLFGRLSSRIEVTYLNGWPHASLTQPASPGDTTLSIDDITGWLGAAGILYGQALQETVVAVAVTPNTAGAVSGPGTVTLATALVFAHQVGDIVSSLPGSVIQATILYCVVQALTRGATSTAVQSLGGTSSGSGGLSASDLEKSAQTYVHAYRRVI